MVLINFSYNSLSNLNLSEPKIKFVCISSLEPNQFTNHSTRPTNRSWFCYLFYLSIRSIWYSSFLLALLLNKTSKALLRVSRPFTQSRPHFPPSTVNTPDVSEVHLLSSIKISSPCDCRKPHHREHRFMSCFCYVRSYLLTLIVWWGTPLTTVSLYIKSRRIFVLCRWVSLDWWCAEHPPSVMDERWLSEQHALTPPGNHLATKVAG